MELAENQLGLVIIVIGVFFSVLILIAILMERLFKFRKRCNELQMKNSEYQKRIEKLKESNSIEVNRLQKEKRRVVEKKAEMEKKMFNEISIFKAEIEDLNQQIKIQTENLSAMQDKYDKVLSLYPSLEEDIAEQELRKEAKAIDLRIISAMTEVASKDNINLFKGVLDLYEHADDKIKEYITADIEKVKSLYRGSITLEMEFEKEKNAKIE